MKWRRIVMGALVAVALLLGVLAGVASASPEEWHTECVDTPTHGSKCLKVFGPGEDQCSTDEECQPLPADCDALAKSFGYAEGTCRHGQVYQHSPPVCEPGEVPLGWTKDCYIPAGMAGAKAACCAKPKNSGNSPTADVSVKLHALMPIGGCREVGLDGLGIRLTECGQPELQTSGEAGEAHWHFWPGFGDGTHQVEWWNGDASKWRPLMKNGEPVVFYGSQLRSGETLRLGPVVLWNTCH